MAAAPLRDLRIAPDSVGGHDIVGDEQPTLRVELWRTLDCAATAASGLLLTLAAGPRRQRSVRTAARAATPAEEFGFLGGGSRSGQPPSSELTRQMMGWEPTHVGLIEDIEQGHYAD